MNELQCRNDQPMPSSGSTLILPPSVLRERAGEGALRVSDGSRSSKTPSPTLPRSTEGGRKTCCPSLHLLVSYLLATLSILTNGCGNPFDPGANDLHYSRDRLRVIGELDLDSMSESQPTPLPATMPTSRPATRPAPAEIALTVVEVRQRALHNNLDLRVEVINPTIARTSVSEEEARFEATLVGDASYSKIDSPTGSRLSSNQATLFSATGGVQIPLITGGNVLLQVPVSRSATDNEFSLFNPVLETDATAGLVQPLLRGAGVDVNYHLIRIAKYEYQAAQARTKLEVIRVLAEVERVYWQLYAARGELHVRERQYDLAVAQLLRAKRQVGAGAVAEVEIIRAESGVADQVEAIIISDNNVRDRQRELKRMMNDAEIDLGSETAIIPATDPVALNYTLDPQRLSEIALNKRMEMLESELQLAQEASNVSFARNQTLPLATLNYNYNVNGLGRSWRQSFDLLRDKDFEDHTVGMHVEIPIGNEAARSRLRRALLSRMQALATKDQRIAQIRQEVFNAMDSLAASWQRIIAGRERVVLAARVVEAEIRQFNIGTRTSTEVLDAQTKLADARLSEINAVTDYQIAQVDLAFATGTIVGRSRVIWEPARMPKE